MRLMSFAYTPEQIRNRSKFVTRRIGWKNLKPGTLLQAVRKSRGRKTGEPIEELAVIRVVKVTQERVSDIRKEKDGTAKEGYPELSADDFVRMFCEHHDCTSLTVVTRIEFEYVDE